MSDMYLVLRRRLETVASEWVPIESDILYAALKRKGYSYESFARQIPVAAKTAERWIKRGRVPLWHVERVAELLDLEIERPIFEPPTVKVGSESTQPADPRQEQIDRMEAQIAEILRRLGGQEGVGS